MATTCSPFPIPLSMSKNILARRAASPPQDKEHPYPKPHSRPITPPLTPPPEEKDQVAHSEQNSPTMDESKDTKSPGATEAKDISNKSLSRNPNLKVNTQKANGRPRIGRLPSLQQITERLSTNANATTATTLTTVNKTATADASSSSSSPTEATAALTDVTTTAANLAIPSQPPSRSTTPSGSRRLKLPASAMTRANLPSAFAKSPKPLFGGEAGKVSVTEEPESMEPTVAKDRVSENRSARASLGVGHPGLPHAETPPRPAKTGGDVPDLVVVESTPERGEKSQATVKPEDRFTNDDGEHPLQHNWTLFYDSKTYKPESPVKSDHLSAWEANLLSVGSFNTVQGFARHMNNIRLPSTLAKGSNYHLFKNGIRPMWEDPANKEGGKWVMFIRGVQLLDASWANLVMATVGDALDDDDKVCGIVASARPKFDRIQVWTRVADDVEYLNALAQRILDCLNLDPRETENVSLEFQPHSSSKKASPELMKMAFPTSVSRSVSLASLSANGGERLRRSPSTPGSFGSAAERHSPSAVHGSSPLAVPTSPTPMRRTGSAGANAFAGPLGASRRLASTTAADF